MKRLLAALLLVPVLGFAQAPSPQQPNNADSQTDEFSKLNWQKGPSRGSIGPNASIQIPKGYEFLGEADTSRFLELNGNPPGDDNYTLAPSSLNWFAIFSFSDTGYIKDDEKIDPDKLLKQLKDGDVEENAERKRLGLPALYTDGWVSPPHYDPQTKRLEWGIQLHSSDGGKNVNYTSRILGRTGVMSVTLVGDPETLDQDIREFKQTLAGFTYNPGETYAEFKQGDKIAEYGLAALILGGAAAVATKKGFWAVIAGTLAAAWKLIAAAAVAVFAGIAKFFKRKK